MSSRLTKCIDACSLLRVRRVCWTVAKNHKSRLIEEDCEMSARVLFALRLLAPLVAVLSLTRPALALTGASVQALALLGPHVAQSNAADQSPFGFSCDNATTYTLANYCGRMAEAGLIWIRGFPTFNVLEPERGRFEWQPADAFLATATEHGMKVCGLFLYSTPWIPPGAGHLPVRNLPAWAEYVSAVVNRYKDQVKHWEVWNETPNFIADGTAEDYARTVVAAYEAAKKADPSCQVGLSIQSVNVHWIQQVIAAGARNHFDFIAVHPYEVLGLVESDGLEAQYMSIVPTIRKMLAASNPSRAQVPIWFTEIGYDAGHDEPGQASALVKAFVLGIAQGVERIFWFEGIDGDSGPMGLLRADGTPRLAYTAARILTTHLGMVPRYLGWVLLNDRHYGFVFTGPQEPVMAAWARPGTTDEVRFQTPVRGVDTQTGAVSQGAVQRLTPTPVLFLDLPQSLVQQAQANRDKPLPWDGDYTGATAVFVSMGGPNVERGLHHLGADRSSIPVIVEGVAARDCGKAAGQAFTVDPNFLCYDTVPIAISVVVRAKQAGDNPGFNLKYESPDGWKGTGAWFTVPGADRWYTQTWVIRDPQFVGKWGYHFALDSDSQTYSQYYLRSVVVTKLPG